MVEPGSFHAIVPAGGAGTRLWPLSRAGNPKFLLDLSGTGRSMLQATVDRLAPVVDGLLVVTGTRHAEAVAAQLPELAAADLLVEPSPRESMAAIGLAAAVLVRRFPDSAVVVGSFAADHVIAQPEAFAEAVRTAVRAARDGLVVTIGIDADHPSTAYGYIEAGAALGEGVYAVEAFVEKPDAETAASYLATGRYRWNAGMYVAQATVLLGHLARYQPGLHAGLTEIAASWDGPDRDEVVARVWPSLTKISIDHAISEPLATEGGIAVVPASLGWSDVGDFRSLADLNTALDGGARVLGDASLVRTPGSPGAYVVPTADQLVVVLGVPNAVVVQTPDVLLVTTVEHAQGVKKVVDGLAAERPDLL